MNKKTQAPEGLPCTLRIAAIGMMYSVFIALLDLVPLVSPDHVIVLRPGLQNALVNPLGAEVNETLI